MARACLSCSKSTLKLNRRLELRGKTDGVDEAAERGEIERACQSASEDTPALSQDKLSEVCNKCRRGTGATISAGSAASELQYSETINTFRGQWYLRENSSSIRTYCFSYWRWNCECAASSFQSWRSTFVVLNSARRSGRDNFVCEFPSIPHPRGLHPF